MRGVDGATPNEVFEGRDCARDGPRYERRTHYPLGKTPLRRAPKTVRGKRDMRLMLVVSHFEARKHLPAVELRRAA